MAGVNQDSSPDFASAKLVRKTRDVPRVASQNMGPRLARACAYGASAIEQRAKLKCLRIMTACPRHTWLNREPVPSWMHGIEKSSHTLLQRFAGRRPSL